MYKVAEKQNLFTQGGVSTHIHPHASDFRKSGTHGLTKDSRIIITFILKQVSVGMVVVMGVVAGGTVL